MPRRATHGLPDLPGLHVVHAKDTRYVYAYRGGPRLPDPRAVSRDAFAREYAAAILTKPIQRSKGRRFAGLIDDYLASGDFTRLAESTQRERRRALEYVKAELGDLSLAAIQSDKMRATVIDFRDDHADTPKRADTLTEAINVVLNRALDRREIKANQAAKIGKLYRFNRSDVVWTEDELQSLIEAATPALKPLLRFAAETGLRRGDLVEITWESIDWKDETISWRTSKSGRRKRASIPLSDEALDVLKGLRRDRERHRLDLDGAIFLSSNGTPWTPDGMSAAFDRARVASKTAKRFHDLRGTAATRFAAAGLTDREIADIMGWEDAEQAAAMRKRYVDSASVAASIRERMKANTNARTTARSTARKTVRTRRK